MDRRNDGVVSDFWTACGRRTNPVISDHVFLSVLHDLFWSDAGRCDSESGGGDPGGAARWLSDFVPACRLHLCGGKHACAAEISFILCADALLPGTNSGRVSPGWGLVRFVGRTDCARIVGNIFLLAFVGRDEGDADQSLVSCQ